MSGFFDLLAAIFGWLTGRKKKDYETTEAEHGELIAEKQASILTDHTRATTDERLHDGSF